MEMLQRIMRSNHKSTWKQRIVVWSYVVTFGLVKSAMKQKENVRN